MPFLLQRLLQAAVVILTVALLSFLVFRFVGDPVNSMVAENATIAERQEMRARLGLDQPVYVQFGRFVRNAAVGNFGVSYRNQQPVARLILERLPATLELVLAAALLSIIVGVPLGVYTALNPKSWGAQLTQSVSLAGISVPTFVTGIMLILIFSVSLRWLPSFGRGEVVRIGSWSTGLLTTSGLKALVLPVISLALFQVTMVMRLIRAEMLDVLRADYIRFARARGLPSSRIHFRHALRNALMPVVTMTGMQIGSLIAFAIVTETVFQWPGMGSLLIQSITFVDIPVMSAYLMFIGLMFVSINTTIDLLYFVIDPRLRHSPRR